MSPKAIHDLIDLFGVEHGIKILNMFTLSNVKNDLREPLKFKKRPAELARGESPQPVTHTE